MTVIIMQALKKVKISQMIQENMRR